MLNLSEGSLRRAARCGVSSIYIVVALIALCGFVSFGVDYGRVQLSKSQLQAAADAAVRAAAAKIDDGVTASRNAAVAVAAANTCAGDAVVLDPVADVEFGTWSKTNRTFTPLSGAAQNSANAIRVTARRVAARDTAIPLVFAKLVGKSSFDIEASAIAVGGTGMPGVVGLSHLDLKNNTEIASYRSADGPPGDSNLWPEATLGSNELIELENNGTIDGDIYLGPGGDLSIGSGTVFTGEQSSLSSALSYPSVDVSGASSSNDNSQIGLTSRGRSPLSGTDFSLTNESITLPAGTYYFTSLTLGNNGSLSFSGPVTIYINGNTTVASTATITTYQARPANLRIRVAGTRTFTLENTVQLTADLYAPQSVVTLENGVMVAGAMIAYEINAINNARVYFDESLIGNGTGDGYGFQSTPLQLVR